MSQQGLPKKSKFFAPDIKNEVLERAKKIAILVLDVDGVMTDGGLIQGDDGLEYKRFHARDGLGLKMLRNTGIKLAIVTGRESVVVKNRAKEIGVVALHENCHRKFEAVNQICEQHSVTLEQCAFMGDDIIDLPPMRKVGLALSVADAHALVLAQSHWVSHKNGGQGAVREAAELLMWAQGTLQTAMAEYIT